MSIRLAERMQRIRPSATVSITALALKLRAEGQDIISLSAGEPDFDTPEHVKAAAVEAMRRGDTKYTAVDGTPALKEAIVRKFERENGLRYSREQVLVSNGAKQCCYNLCLALLQAGDEAVIPAPYWVSYPDMVRLADAEPVIVETTAETGFRMTAAQLEGAITARTRIVIFNSPCNPTGAVYSRRDWEELGAVLRARPDIVILADDIYEHILWTEEPFSTIAQVCPYLYERTVTVNGVSKAYAMTGWRLGYAAGPAALVKAMASIQGQSTTNASSISQAAATAALNGDQHCVRKMREGFKERYEFVRPRLNAIPGFTCPPAGGAFYAFPNVAGAIASKGLADDVELCLQLMERAGVAVVPGSAFGAPGHLRMSFACSLATLEQALARIERYVRT